MLNLQNEDMNEEMNEKQEPPDTYDNIGQRFNIVPQNRPEQRPMQVRGDAFDIMGGGVQQSQYNQPRQPDIIDVFRNPQVIMDRFGLNKKQAENVRSMIVGGGTGSIHRILSQHLGDELSAVIGALASTYISKKIMGNRNDRNQF
jgi:hypothetical protein